MSGSSQTTTTNQTVAPYAYQNTSLQNLFTNADAAYAQSAAVPAYTGNFVQGVSQNGQNAMNGALANTTGGATSAVNSLYGNANGALSSGLAGSNNAISGMNNFANTNTAANNVTNAQAYMNPTVINNQVQAAMQSADQNYNEVVNPTINTQGAASGNALSSREGIASGIAQRSLNQTAADESANLTANAYNTGITASQNLGQQNLSALSSAGSLASALNSQGISGASAGLSGNATDANTINTINNAQIGYGQDTLDNSIDATNYADTQPFQALNQYNAIVNSRNIGSQTNGTSTVDNNPSLLSTIGSGLGAVGGLVGKCDRDLKTDIELIGYTLTGVPFYSFSYKTDNERKLYTGFMADEIEQIDPSLVYTIHGAKHIKANDFVRYLKSEIAANKQLEAI